MNGAPTLRLAAATDFAAIAAITNHYIRHTAIHFGTDDVGADELRDAWRGRIDLYPWLVAEQAGTVVGYAKAGEFRTRAAYRWTCETGVYLAPDRRGHGIGALVYGRLCTLLRAQGFGAAIGVIALPNPASVRLHEQLGFGYQGTLPRVGRKFDAWHDIGFWQLPLQADGHVPGAIRAPAAAFAS